MTLYDVKQKMATMTDEQLKNVVIQGWWDIEQVDDRIEELKKYGRIGRKFTNEEKRYVLQKAIDNCGGENQDEIFNEIDSLLIKTDMNVL